MTNPSFENDLQEGVDEKVKRPKKFKVVLLNDDFTPIDFVIQILQEVFNKNHQDAHNITMDIHQKEKGICGVFSKDVAETKAKLVCQLAEKNGFPLTAISEED
jgi:ATP-dependent Clp protease adaptor protein ClpS